MVESELAETARKGQGGLIPIFNILVIFKMASGDKWAC